MCSKHAVYQPSTRLARTAQTPASCDVLMFNPNPDRASRSAVAASGAPPASSLPMATSPAPASTLAVAAGAAGVVTASDLHLRRHHISAWRALSQIRPARKVQA